MPFLGVPLLRYTLEVLHRAGVTAVGLNTHHLPEVMEATARAECGRLGMPEPVLVHETVIQGTGGGIRGLREFLGAEETFVVFNGDILFQVDLETLLVKHRASGAAATMVLLPMPAGESYAAVEMDEGKQVRRIGGQGPGGEGLTPWHFTGVHLMSAKVFDFMREGVVEDINRDVYPRMIEKGLSVQGVVAKGYWSDLGTPARYLTTQGDVLLGRGGLHAVVKAGILVDRGASVAPGVELGPNVYVGEGVQVSAGTRLSEAALLEGTVLTPGESLHGVVAWGGDVRMPA
jgi:mannose-1-phosphate guanylyltransferase